MDLGERVGYTFQKLRLEKGLTQEDFAKKLGVTSRSVRRWEAGKSLPTVKTLKKMERIFNVNISILAVNRKEHHIG